MAESTLLPKWDAKGFSIVVVSGHKKQGTEVVCSNSLVNRPRPLKEEKKKRYKLVGNGIFCCNRLNGPAPPFPPSRHSP